MHPSLRHAMRRAIQLHHRDGLAMPHALVAAGARDAVTIGTAATWLRPHADLDQLREQGKALCRAIAPELVDRPFYVMWFSDLPPEHHDIALGGWWGRALSVLAKDSLTAAGRWRGPGVAVAINDRRVGQDSGADDAAEVERALFYTTLLHEFAHVVENDFSFTPEGVLRDIPRAHQHVAAKLTTLEAPPHDAPWFAGHEARFIRAACHVWYRAELFGVQSVPFFASHPYGLSPIARYAETLAAECTAMRHRPFRQILDSSPPPAFTGLWESDVRRWYAEHPA